MKKVLFSVMAILLAVGVVGGGAFALFSDVETVEVGDIAAGTLDLTVDDANPCIQHVTIKDIAPGWSQEWTWKLTNTGSLPGKLSIEFTPIVNKENGRTEPEIVAGDVYGDGGELGAKLEQYTTINGGLPWTAVGGCAYRTAYTDWDILNRLGWFGSGCTWHQKTDDILDPQEEAEFVLRLRLPSEVDNIIQSDSVEFDIIFHLDQVTP